MKMSQELLQKPELHFGAFTFFAKEHIGETCGSNGLPLTPNSIIIFGRAQFLMSLKHPNLCQYLDIMRGKHERTIIVSQYSGCALSNFDNKNYFTIDNIKKIAYQILIALKELHSKNIVHRNLSRGNVLLQENGDIKLYNYGLFHMTDRGKLVTFPILQVLYTAPEVYLDGPNGNLSNPKVDVWSLGIILTELVLGISLWQFLKLGQRIRKVLSLVQGNTSVLERICREHNCYEKYQSLPADLKIIIEDCLTVIPKERATVDELLNRDMFDDFRIKQTTHKICQSFEMFTIKELYHWWQLAGGDVYLELKKQGVIRSSPPILSVPKTVLIDSSVLGQERDPATLYDEKLVEMPLEALYDRFKHLPLVSFYPLIHSKSKIITNSDESLLYDVTGLPLIIRERDPEYQFHRIILLRRLLHGYPFTREMVLKEAEKDIPPLIRGDIWAALLNVRGDFQREYVRIDKKTPTATDRQIEVDIPRCHQYNEFLSSNEGHKKLKRILKAWIFKHSNYVYWQGLDSLTAPFLYLNFNDEAKAFACLSAFVPKYLHKFFLKDNSAVIQEYLRKFSQLIAFHDPKLANHLRNINFIPELFAIPWFLTMFSHVFPLHKILHLWDRLLLGDSSFPLHVGLSILDQLRDTLLNSDFNECILLFSDLPEIDIEQCVCFSMETYKITPKSVTFRKHQDDQMNKFDAPLLQSYPTTYLAQLHLRDATHCIICLQPTMSSSSISQNGKEQCSTISTDDFVDLIKNSVRGVITVDIRNPLQFNRCSVKGSINVPCSSVKFGDINVESVMIRRKIFQHSRKGIVVVVGTEETDLELFSSFLLQCNIPKVCILREGFDALLPVTPTILITHNQI